ncbi:hypothetical protein K469DRAFT_321544 [Zopfia rhizophila CBS 207.26]|uniref:Uncharacterized protein n=1 Tax=Zopfia rhizophila CBS 207.26 TaxID=1314779 RepID=A0A6A6DHS8_9PEZI|nr:hypothetical protein K469DRAFT_321544 [Zopfia rhizophila CBS 207.26]
MATHYENGQRIGPGFNFSVVHHGTNPLAKPFINSSSVQSEAPEGNVIQNTPLSEPSPSSGSNYSVNDYSDDDDDPRNFVHSVLSRAYCFSNRQNHAQDKRSISVIWHTFNKQDKPQEIVAIQMSTHITQPDHHSNPMVIGDYGVMKMTRQLGRKMARRNVTESSQSQRNLKIA